MALLGLHFFALAFFSYGEQGLLCCRGQAFHCSGFSCCGVWAPGMWAQ